MKVEKIIVATLITGMLAFSCNDAEKSVETENTEKAPEKEVNDEPKEESNEVDSNEEKSVETVKLEDKAYAVEEFITTYNENIKGVEGQTVEIEGFYMGHSKQKDANSDEEYEYNVSLYEEASLEKGKKKVFFMMKSNDADQFKGIMQKDKIIVKGVITGENFFDAPKLEDGVVIK
ncbi:MAG: hypothetical protein WED10_13940 [Brumimicrobium sp.]